MLESFYQYQDTQIFSTNSLAVIIIFFPENKLIQKEDQICLQNGSLDGYVQWSRCNLWKQTTAAVLVAPTDALSHGWFWLLFILAFADTPQQTPTAEGGAPYNWGTELEQISSAPVHTALHRAPQTQLWDGTSSSCRTRDKRRCGRGKELSSVKKGRLSSPERNTWKKETESCCQMLTSFQVSIYTPGCG